MTHLSSPAQGLAMDSQDSAKWAVVVVMVAVGLFALVTARQLLAPIDELVTSQACSTHGDKLQRPVIDYERSNRFGLFNRTHGSCLFGEVTVDEGLLAGEGDATEQAVPVEPAPDGDTQILGADADPNAQLLLGLDEIDPGSLYRALKIMGVVLQLGAASLVVRLLGEPLLDRFVRSRR
jgi:hypothetical protein